MLLALGLGCGPAPRAGHAPDPGELAPLVAFLRSPVATVPFRASGHVHFRSPDGEVDGAIRVRVDPPRRAWLELRTRALFGLVGERVVVSLPGDGHLLVYRERADDLQSLDFSDSPAALLSLGGGVPELLQLLGGHVPWPGGAPPSDLADRTQVQDGGSGGNRVYRLRVGPGSRSGEVLLRLAGGDLERFEWWVGDERRLVVQYDRFVPLGAARYPARVRVQAPGDRLRCEMDLERLEPQAGFEAQDFEIGGSAEPPEGRGG